MSNLIFWVLLAALLVVMFGFTWLGGTVAVSVLALAWIVFCASLMRESEWTGFLNEDSMTPEGKQRVWLGADPGAKGAIALVEHPAFAAVYPLRDVDDRVLFQLLRNLRDKFDIQFALIEKINPVPDYVLPAVSTHKLLQHYAVLKNAIAEARDPDDGADSRALLAGHARLQKHRRRQVDLVPHGEAGVPACESNLLERRRASACIFMPEEITLCRPPCRK